MSELRVDSVKSKGGGAPDLPKGVTISGITTAATLGATTVDVSNVNVSGVVTSGTLSGDLLSTGTPTLGLGVTINSSGLVVSGVATAGIVSATTLYGDGSNLTGIGASIAPLFYNPDPYDTLATVDTGIGITFNQQVKAGTGNVTLSIANAGVAGTVVENFGVGSSVTISENRITINPTADLSSGFAQYFISYPSGCFTNNEGTAYVGTGYTFGTQDYLYQLWLWGLNNYGQLGLNNTTQYSSPVQLPGTNWDIIVGSEYTYSATKTDGTLWTWGYNNKGELGQNTQGDSRSSPVQIPGTTWPNEYRKLTQGGSNNSAGAIKTDGTLWVWGNNNRGQLGQNAVAESSSPVQIPGTTWVTINFGQSGSAAGVKTDGTLWMWGHNAWGNLGQNSRTHYSSPVQVPGTTWDYVRSSKGSWYTTIGRKTDGTLWSWGYQNHGEMGINIGGSTYRSSPVQIPGTSWGPSISNARTTSAAIKTDGTLWSWGQNDKGQIGVNVIIHRSSPTQIPGTTWSKVDPNTLHQAALKTDGTLWTWGSNEYGALGLNQAAGTVKYSSPVQIPGTWSTLGEGNYSSTAAIKVVS